jgi:plastocyanin
VSRSLAASRATPVLAFAFPSALAALALAAAALITFMLTPAALGAPTPAAASARAATLKVAVEYRRFSPYSLAALPGDTVTWTNTGGRTHTVTADAGQFDSGDLPVGHSFTQLFTTAGSYVYHCAIHTGMVGEIEVRRVTLQPLPRRAIAAGSRVTLLGRTVEPTVPVRIQRDTGRGFETVATVSPNADGTWKAQVAATKTVRYRAAVGADLSQTRRLLVISRPCRCGSPVGRSQSRSSPGPPTHRSRCSCICAIALAGGRRARSAWTLRPRQASGSSVPCVPGSPCWGGMAGPRSRSARCCGLAAPERSADS